MKEEKVIHDKKFLWEDGDVADIRVPQCNSCIYRTGLFKCSEYTPIPRMVMFVKEPCPKYRKAKRKEVDV